MVSLSLHPITESSIPQFENETMINSYAEMSTSSVKSSVEKRSLERSGRSPADSIESELGSWL